MRGRTSLLGFAIALMLLLLGCVACGSTPSPKTPAIPATAAPSPTFVPNAKAMVFAGLSPAAVVDLIRSNVSGARPVLAVDVPPDWSGDVSFPEAGSFGSWYRAPDGAQSIQLSLVLANLPDPGATALQSSPGFHGDARSVYQVEDGGNAASQRELLWTEPGTWTVQPEWGGVPYLLTATGMTDAEFWSLADSLHPVE